MLFVTHDIDEALILADRIVFMEPKHIVRSFDLPRTRTRSVDEVAADPQVQDVKREVLRLFDATSPEREAVL